VKLCDRTIFALAGDEHGAIDGFVWKGGKTTRACDPDWTGYQLSMFKQDYDARLFERARGVLGGYLRTCGPRLRPEARLAILSNLAVTSFHLGDYPECRAYVKQARKLPGFDRSASKASLEFNESACANPPVDAKPPNHRWLLDEKSLSANLPGGPKFEALLAATVPSFDFATAQLDRRVKGWLSAGLKVPRGAVKARSEIGLRTMIRDRLTLPGDENHDGRDVVANRYVVLWGCRPHSCEERSMIWVDVETGSSGFATNSFFDCYAVGSRTFGPGDIPAAFKQAAADWRQNKQPLGHDCTAFIDGSKGTVSVTPLK
jgi:hypothetical protein